MKKFFKATLILLAMIFMLTGCTSNELSPSNIALVIGNRANNAVPNLEAARAIVEEACGTFGMVTAVTVEGSPKIVPGAPFDLKNHNLNLPLDREEELISSWGTQILDICGSTLAISPEADLLAAIDLATRSLRSSSESEDMSLVIIDSMISTKDPLDLTLIEKFEELDSSIIDFLEENDMLPDLKSIDVVIVGLGDTAPPERALSHQERILLQSFWSELLYASGAESVVINPAPGTSSWEENVDFPCVSTLLAENVVDSPFIDGRLILTEEMITFVANKADFLDSDKALSVLRPVSDYLIENVDMNLLLVGSTAGDELLCDDEDIELSLRRATRVKELLVEYGIDESRLTVIGMGSGDPWHVPGLGYTEMAATNRKVVLIDASSEVAQDILSSIQVQEQ